MDIKIKKLQNYIIIFIVVIFALSLIKSEIQRVKLKKEEGKKKESVYKKYLYDYNVKEILESVKKNVVRNEIKELEDGKYEINYYDSQNRVIYKIFDKNKITGWVKKHGSKRNIIDIKSYEIKNEEEIQKIMKNKGYNYEYFYDLSVDYPEENAIVYDKNGRKDIVIKINESGGSYGISNIKNREERQSFYNNGRDLRGSLSITKYTYKSDKEYTSTEYRTNTHDNMFLKIDKEYTDNILLKEKEIINNEDENINIEITILKKYINGRVAEKIIIRKDNNSTNFIESIVNFEKSEIVTNFYLKNKLIAKSSYFVIDDSKAIIKKENLGMNYIFWDFYIRGEYNDNHDIYIENKVDSKIKYMMIGAKSNNRNLGLFFNFRRGVDIEEYFYNYNFIEESIDKIYVKTDIMEVSGSFGDVEKIKEICDADIKEYIDKAEGKIDVDIILKEIDKNGDIEKYKKENLKLINSKNEKVKDIKDYKDEFLKGRNNKKIDKKEVWNEIQNLKSENDTILDK